MLPAMTPPMVGVPVVPNSPRWSIGSNARRWFSAASASSISATGVPGFATSVSAPGSYSVIPCSPAMLTT